MSPDNLLLWFAVVLAAVEVTLTALAVVIAVVAIFGRRAVIDGARREARRAAESEVELRLQESNLRAMILQAVQKEGDILYNDIYFTSQNPKSEENKYDRDASG